MNPGPSDSQSVRVPRRHSACLGLGSNHDAAQNLRLAWQRLCQLVTVDAVSQVWQSPACGDIGADYLNAALLVKSSQDRDDLRHCLKQTERDLGRSSTPSPVVPIDIDLLVFDGIVQTADLWNLAYCAVPVAQLLPDMICPDTQETLADVASRLRAVEPIQAYPDLFRT